MSIEDPSPNETPRAKPRQERGQRRSEAILNAASELFAEAGYASTTVAQIAARAGAAVGTLYQFYTNKEDILRALTERYVARATVVFEQIDVESFPGMTLEATIRAMLLPLKEFVRDNRDFQALLSHPTGSAFVEETIRAMDAAFVARVDASLAVARPYLSAHERRKYSLVCMIIMKGLLGLASRTDELTLDEIFDEMEAVYLRYLMPVMGEDAADQAG